MSAKKKRKFWTANQVLSLRTASRKKEPAWKIASRFRRTEGAVRQKAHALGLSLDTRAAA